MKKKNLILQLKKAMLKLEAETGLKCTCITLHPEHWTQLRDSLQCTIVPEIEQPIYYKGIPVYKAELPDARDMSTWNPCLVEGFSIVGHYDYTEDYYVHEQHIKINA